MDYPTVTVRIEHGVPSAEVAIVAKPDDGNMVETTDVDPPPVGPPGTGLPTWMLNAV